MKTIICPIDFSEPANNAARYAADMAAALDMSVCLLHVCPLPVTIAEVPLPPFPFDQTISEAKEKIAALKDQLLYRVQDRIAIHTEVRQGFLIKEITAYCEQLQPYAVVMGTEKAKGIERMIEGASTFSAITQLPWPVIVVPEEAVFTGIKKIALACDLQDVVETIPEKEITTLVKSFQAALHVLHVGGEAGSFTPAQVAESGLLQEMLSPLHPTYHFMEGDKVEETLVEFLDRHDFDMLFVFPKQHSLLERVWRHSRSKRLVMQSHIPIAALHESRG